MKFRKLRSFYRENKKLDFTKTLIFSLFKQFYSNGLFNWTKTVFKKLTYIKSTSLSGGTSLIDINYWKLCNTMLQIWCIRSVVIQNLLYYMNFERVSATPYYNYFLLCILLLDVFCSTIWNLVEHKLLFLAAILCCILLFVTISFMTFMRYFL